LPASQSFNRLLPAVNEIATPRIKTFSQRLYSGLF
jgi:hypothetical protein